MKQYNEGEIMSPILLPYVYLHEISCAQIFNKHFGTRSLLQFYKHILIRRVFYLSA